MNQTPPAGWTVVPLGQLAKIERGRFTARPRNDPKYYGGKYPFIQTGDVRSSGGKIESYSQSLNEAGVKVSKLFPAGTLFLTIAANIGDLGISQFPCACPDSLVAVRPHLDTDQVWLLYALSSQKQVLESIASQNAQANLNLAKLNPFPMLVPPHGHQCAIAEALEDVDKLIAGLRQTIAKKQAIKQGMMQQLLTGRTRLPGFNSEWSRTTVGQVSEFLTGYPFESASFESTGIRLIRGSNVKRGEIDWSPEIAKYWAKLDPSLREFSLRDGDIIIAMDGALVGRSFARITDAELPAYLVQRVARLRGTTINQELLYQWVGSRDFAKHVDDVKTHTAIPHISPRDIREFKISVPVDVNEQRAVAEVLRDTDLHIELLKSRLTRARNIKTGMMQQLLTGRTRLPVEAAS
jgi:type I restriction enzyme S subunit